MLIKWGKLKGGLHMGHKSNETKEFRNTIIASQGDYKLRGDSDPFTFLFACILIPVGALFIFIGLCCIKDLFEKRNAR